MKFFTIVSLLIIKFYIFLQFVQIPLVDSNCQCEFYKQPHYVYQYQRAPYQQPVPDIFNKVHKIVGSSLDLAATAACGGGGKPICEQTYIDDDPVGDNNDNSNSSDDSDGGIRDFKIRKDLTCNQGSININGNCFCDQDDYVRPVPFPQNKIIPKKGPFEKNKKPFNNKNAQMRRKMMLCKMIAQKRNQLTKLTSKLRDIDQNCSSIS